MDVTYDGANSVTFYRCLGAFTGYDPTRWYTFERYRRSLYNYGFTDYFDTRCRFLGTTTTAVSSSDNKANPDVVIGGQTVTAVVDDAVLYNNNQYRWGWNPNATVPRNEWLLIKDGAKINSWVDMHWIPASRPQFQPPKLKTNYVNIPGAHSQIDLSEVATGQVNWENITGDFEFIIENGEHEGSWYDSYNYAMKFFHGAVLMVVLEEYPRYYWEGRFNVSSIKSDKEYSTITLEYTLYPIPIERRDNYINDPTDRTYDAEREDYTPHPSYHYDENSVQKDYWPPHPSYDGNNVTLDLWIPHPSYEYAGSSDPDYWPPHPSYEYDAGNNVDPWPPHMSYEGFWIFDPWPPHPSYHPPGYHPPEPGPEPEPTGGSDVIGTLGLLGISFAIEDDARIGPDPFPDEEDES